MSHAGARCSLFGDGAAETLNRSQSHIRRCHQRGPPCSDSDEDSGLVGVPRHGNLSWGLGFRFRVQGLGFRVQGLGDLDLMLLWSSLLFL